MPVCQKSPQRQWNVSYPLLRDPVLRTHAPHGHAHRSGQWHWYLLLYFLQTYQAVYFFRHRNLQKFRYAVLFRLWSIHRPLSRREEVPHWWSFLTLDPEAVHRPDIHKVSLICRYPSDGQFRLKYVLRVHFLQRQIKDAPYFQRYILLLFPLHSHKASKAVFYPWNPQPQPLPRCSHFHRW